MKPITIVYLQKPTSCTVSNSSKVRFRVLCIKDTLGPAIYVLNREVSSSRRLKYTESIGKLSFEARKLYIYKTGILHTVAKLANGYNLATNLWKK